MIRFSPDGWRDYVCWSDEPKALQRINRLIRESARDPGAGIGRTEMLKGDLAGCWSRRITHEHRLVYTVIEGDLVVLQARHHYR